MPTKQSRSDDDCVQRWEELCRLEDGGGLDKEQRHEYVAMCAGIRAERWIAKAAPKPDDGGPAYPTNAIDNSGFEGRSLRAHAAIELRVPRSGINWLDDMIREAKRDELAGMAMQGMYAATKRNYNNSAMNWPNEAKCSEWAYSQADAMLAERSKGAGDDEVS